MKTFKTLLIIILAVVVLIALYFLFFSDKPIPFLEKEKEYTEQELTEMAKQLFNQKKAEGVDMTNGPCLTNELIPGWVVDVAHSPRQAIDNQPENQCSAFIEGKAKHFIELDIEGNFIKMQ